MKTPKLKIVETFPTLQGEGKYLGTPSYFVRTTGCNLRCEFQNTDGTYQKCDTPYTSWDPEEGYDITPDEILEKSKGIEHIVLTGGEPMLQKDVSEVVSSLNDGGKRVTVETNGTVYRPIPGAFISISPKLQSSYPTSEKERKLHLRNNYFMDSCREFVQNNDYQFKVVVVQEEDLEEIDVIRNNLQIQKNKIYLMPQGVGESQLRDMSEKLWDICVRENYNFTPRLHLNIFGNVRGR